MTSPELPVQLSAIDSERFDIVVARAHSVTPENLQAILDHCAANQVKMLIARCDINDIRSVHAMEQSGFLLMDTLLYYRRDLYKTPIPTHQGYNVRAVTANDQDQVRLTAAEAFRDYFGHYHADPRLDRLKCDEIYSSWAERAVQDRAVADEVLVADREGEILGLAVLRLNNAKEADALLFAVAPRAQRQGVYRSLLSSCLQWALSQGREQLVSSTQITNVASQKSWTRVGFEFSHAFYTFHKWFD